MSVRVYTTQPRMDGSSGVSSDAMMAKLRAGFLQRAEAELATGDADAPLAAGALEWNKQRELCLVRALEGLLYPQLIAELKEQLSREAEAAVSAECAAPHASPPPPPGAVCDASCDPIDAQCVDALARRTAVPVSEAARVRMGGAAVAVSPSVGGRVCGNFFTRDVG